MKPLTILITGATAGIGRHTALVLAKAGHRVFAAGRRQAALETLEKEAGHGLTGIVLDVTKADSIEAAKARIDDLTEGYGVDAVVNNAGYGMLGPLDSMSDADFRAQFETNVFGLMAVTRAFVGGMQRRGFGRIVNISSLGGRVTFPLMGAYHGTKYAVEALSDALRMELHPLGIGVSIVEPGYIKTEFADVALKTIKVPQGSPYLPVVERTDKLLGYFEKTGVGPDHIARAIRKALESKRPSARYVAPWRTYMGLWMFRLLPTAWMDPILRALTGLTPRVLKGTKAALPAPAT